MGRVLGDSIRPMLRLEHANDNENSCKRPSNDGNMHACCYLPHNSLLHDWRIMHPDTPEGLAIKDRTLALWREYRNLKIPVKPSPRFGEISYVGRWKLLVNHYIDGVDIFLNGKAQ